MQEQSQISNLKNSIENFEDKASLAKSSAIVIVDKINNNVEISNKDYTRLSRSLALSVMASESYRANKETCKSMNIEILTEDANRAQKAYENQSYAYDVYNEIHFQFAKDDSETFNQ